MMLTIAIAEKLLRLADGEQIRASLIKHTLIDELISEGIILEQYSGRTKRILYIADKAAFANWLFHRFQINDLAAYIQAIRNSDATRADLILAGNDSKVKARRTFKGFLVNSYQPIEAALNNQPIVIQPTPGTFQFIYDFETFAPPADVVIVGIENTENFRWVAKQEYLFKNIKPLFISRYPQEQAGDVIKWLRSIPNQYLHFGDFDFAGINIYLQEYKKHLGERAFFFIPGNIEDLLATNGNKNLYDQQKLNDLVIAEKRINELIALLHKHKKGLEQEVLIIG